MLFSKVNIIKSESRNRPTDLWSNVIYTLIEIRNYKLIDIKCTTKIKSNKLINTYIMLFY